MGDDEFWMTICTCTLALSRRLCFAHPRPVFLFACRALAVCLVRLHERAACS
jgi:hypothetical protein